MRTRQLFSLVFSSLYGIPIIQKIASHSTPGPQKDIFLIARLPCRQVIIWLYILSCRGTIIVFVFSVQVWYITDLTCLFSLDIETSKYLEIFLAPNSLTIIICNYGSYSQNHDTVQFDLFHFTSQEHLNRDYHVYLPNRRLFIYCSDNDGHI